MSVWIASVDQTTGAMPALVTQWLDKRYGTRRPLSGRYYGAANHALSVGTVGTATLRAIPFHISIAAAFNEISIEVTTAAASTNVRLGIYANDTTRDCPGALIVDAGTVAATTTGVKALTINQTLQPGLYWLASVAQGGNPELRTLVGSLAPVADTAFATTPTLEPNCYFMGGVTTVLPAWSGATPTASSGAPKIMLKAS
ncbi:hypothetical protein ACFVWR_15420 [Leifsonia sp. NPDC058292]|uniref:hypothetical protein n=1 Tax=Leifsonia sp. NPDC058292 TaxID=3346428 RepID=UPI0036DF8150